MMIMIIMMTMNMLMFMQLNNPLTLGLSILMQTIFMSLTLNMMMKSSWFSYVLFMVFVGGLLILFIYVISLASNELFNTSNYKIIMTMMMLIITLFIIIYLLKNDNMMLFNLNNYDMTIMDENMMKKDNMDLIIKIFNQKTMMITLTLMTYLLITLFIIVSITDIFQGPIRQKY